MNRWVIIFGMLMVMAAVPTSAADPAAVAGKLLHARDLVARGVWFDAVEVLEAHLRVAPDDAAARIELAQLYFRLGRYRDAAEAALGVPRDDPIYGSVRWLLLMRLRMRVARDVNWRDVDAVLDFARLCARMESYDRAAQCYQQALDLREIPGVRREYAAMLAWAERYDLAVRHYRIHLDAAPNDVDARYELARVYIALDRLHDAENELMQALKLRADDVDMRRDYVRVLIWLGHTEQADRLLTDHIARHPGDIEARLLRGELLLGENRVEEAEDLLLEVLRIAPDQPRAGRMLRDLRASRRVEIARLRRGLLAEPDRETLREQLIEVYLSVDRPGAALLEMERLAVQRAGDLALRDRIAWLRDRRRQSVRERVRQWIASGLPVDSLKVWVDRNPGDERAERKYAAVLQRRGGTWDAN